MSEYQYYEFLAVDRLLSRREMGELRSISSRAEITPSHFSNEYNWGDLKADPGELLECYFDLHLYLANWGTRRLAVKLPLEGLSLEEVTPYLVSDCASVRRAGEHVIVDLWSEPDDFEDWEEASGWMGTLVAVRTRLLRGDVRPLYLAWLLSVQNDEVEDDEKEPVVPPGLQSLPVELQAMAEFLRIDDHLLTAAAEGSAPEEPEPPGLAQWIGRLPVDEKDALLLRVARGEHVGVEAVLARRFMDEARAAQGAADRTRRTVNELQVRASEILGAWKAERARKAEEARRQREAAAAAAREKHLDALASRKVEVWAEIEMLVSATKPKYYDLAVARLVDLRELAQRDNHEQEFGGRLNELRGRHSRKPSFIARLDKAGLSPGRA